MGRGRRSTLFVGEIHRLNKSQKDLLLPVMRSA
jgi:replication-associated recombination protein RarA